MPPDDSDSTISTLSAISTDSESEGMYISNYHKAGKFGYKTFNESTQTLFEHLVQKVWQMNRSAKTLL